MKKKTQDNGTPPWEQEDASPEGKETKAKAKSPRETEPDAPSRRWKPSFLSYRWI
ncbi:MAG: hypothetical protein JST68_12210, partial [Bacteroidetes bacterium]|nr:hypothetical protein [Bacteroidota bacterium]